MMETIAKILIVAVIWFVIASPLLVLSFCIAKRVRKRSKNWFMSTVGVSFVTALLVAPVPTPIITFLFHLLPG
jgi:threonine/homoserine/homoserine lactone efflux protein